MSRRLFFFCVRPRLGQDCQSNQSNDGSWQVVKRKIEWSHPLSGKLIRSTHSRDRTIESKSKEKILPCASIAATPTETTGFGRVSTSGRIVGSSRRVGGRRSPSGFGPGCCLTGS